MDEGLFEIDMLADPLETRCKCREDREDTKQDKLFLHLQVTLYLQNPHIFEFQSMVTWLSIPKVAAWLTTHDQKKKQEHDRAPLANAKQKTPSASHIPS